MAESATIARPYAQALFRVAQFNAGSLNTWSQLLTEFAQVASLPEIQTAALNPKIPNQQIATLLVSAVKAPINHEANNFINMLAENNRINLLPEISEQFHQLKNAQEGAADAEIVSAFALSPAQTQDLAALLEKKFGRKLNPTVTVDPSLIGGIRVIVGDEVLDTSVRAKLQQMQVALTAQ